MKKKSTTKKPSQSRAISAVQKLSLFFYNHVLFSLSFWMALVIFGVLSYTTFMQRQGFPNIEVPISVVQSTYLVNDKVAVDEDVTQPLLSDISEIEDVKSTNASSTDNVSLIVVEFEEGITSPQGAELIKEATKTSEVSKEAEVSVEPVNASQFANSYDVVLSVHSAEASVNKLNGDAQVAVEKLSTEFPDVEFEVIEQFQNGINPITKQPVNRQTQFDIYGEKVNGEFKTFNSVGIGISFSGDTDIITFDKELNKAILVIEESGEIGNATIAISADFATSVSQQISSLQQNLGTGLLLVVLVCLIFIGVKAGLVAALSMGVTLAVTVGALYLGGLTLNTITLFALILTLGLIVDDAIIITESIDTQRKKGIKGKDAVAVAIKRVALASFAGTMTTILGFAPLLFIGGILGDFIRVMPITIITSLIVSFLVSITFIPFMSHWFARDHKRKFKRSPLHTFREFETKLASGLAKPLLLANTWTKKIAFSFVGVMIAVGFILGSGYFFSQLKFDIFPASKDTDELSMQLEFAPGTTLDQAQEITAQATDKLIESTDGYLEKVTLVSSANERSATAFITLTSYKDRDTKAPELTAQAEADLGTIKGAKITVDQSGAGPPKEEFPFKVQIAAEEPAQAIVAATKLNEHLQGQQIERANGTTATITKTKFTGEQQAITRVDGIRVVEVSAGFSDDDVSALVQAAQTNVEKFIESPDNRTGLSEDSYTFDFGSETENQESFKGVLVALPILLVAMFVLLAIQFRSILQPLLIMFAMPFSFFGVALGLYVTDNPLSFFVMVGFFALIGISVNNTILLTDFANQERRNGATPREAIAAAVKLRFRPLLTTSITSVLALLPLALSEPFWESLAYTLIFGLISSTILVLVSFPYFYLIMERVRRGLKAVRVATFSKLSRSK
jgi:multidrug efflux pump subunit AcrB